MMDEEYTHDVERVMENIDRAEVLSVFFPRLQKALVLDVRANETDGPLVRLLPMLSRWSDPLTEPVAGRAQAVKLELQNLIDRLRRT